MPFCTQCGTQVDAAAAYCQHCGSPQPRDGEQTGPSRFSGLSDRSASMLCYIPVFGVIPAILFLVTERYRANLRIRFDAFQSLYLFVAWLIISAAAPGFLVFGVGDFGMQHAMFRIIKFVMFISWIYLLVKASRHEPARLPVIGDLAERSASEQV